MSLVDEVGGGLDGFSQLRARMASGRKPGILVALDSRFLKEKLAGLFLPARREEHADGSGEWGLF